MATQTMTDSVIPGVRLAPEQVKVAQSQLALSALSALPVGGTGRVVGLMPNAALDATMTRVLLLGLVPGTEVTVVRRAPLGDPTEYELRGYRLCLRRSEASQIQVQILPESA